MQKFTENNEYLVMLLTAKQYKIFHGIDNQLEKIRTHVPDHTAAYHNTIPAKTDNFTNSQDRKEVVLDKFVYHADEGLDEALKEYHLPVFLIATERAAGHFMKTSHHAKAITAYVHGNYEEASVSEILDVLAPHIAGLHKGYEKMLGRKIEKAIDACKFCFGFDDVKRKARLHRGSILVLEWDYPYPANLEFVVKDVMESGGSVAHAEDGMLDKYGHIGLIQYY